MPFPFESLSVYDKSLDLVENIHDLAKELSGKVPYTFIDQLTRAALSVPLNIAEGQGRWHKKEKLQFLRIAKGSIFEIIPIIQILHRKNILNEAEYKNLYFSLETITKMLVNLIKSVETRDEIEVI